MSKSQDFSALWVDAVLQYEKRTQRSLDKESQFREFQSLADLGNALELEGHRFQTFRSERRKLYSALARCIAPMEPVLQAVQKAIGPTPYAPASAVLGAASYLMLACGSVTTAYDGIEELFDQMGDITVRLEYYECGSMESSLQQKMTGILAYFLDIIGKAEACIKRKRVKQWARSLVVQEDEISSSVAKLKKYVDSELSLVTALTYQGVKTLQTTVIDSHDKLGGIQRNLAKMSLDQCSDRQRAFSEVEDKMVQDALKTETVDAVAREHAANLEKLTHGTGLWIVNDTTFQAWEQEEAPILWVFGKPGVGKTMLATKTMETLQAKYSQYSDKSARTSVSYLCFKDSDPSLQDCARLWKTAGWQITKANDRFKKHVITTTQEDRDTFASARCIWRKLFLDFFLEDTSSQSPRNLAFLIVDGLDEALQEERVKFLSCLADLVDICAHGHRCRIQVAIFARPDIRVDPGFDKLGSRIHERVIEVTPDKTNPDIKTFIQQRLMDISVLKTLKKRKMTKDYHILAKKIYHSVQTRSEGMFLWARLVLEQTRDLPSPEAIERTLNEAPQGLDNMLYHVFKRLEIEDKCRHSYLNALLLWVYSAHHPLSVAELFVLFLVSDNQHCYTIEDDLRSRYASLFSVTDPVIDNEQEDGEPNNLVVDTSEPENFDFLDDDELGNDGERHMDESDWVFDAQLQAEDIIPGTAGDSGDAFEIPSHWNETTITFSHARIRDFLTIEGDPATRRWHDCPVVPQDSNTSRLDTILVMLRVLNTDIADDYLVPSLKSYAKKHWMKPLLGVDFARIDTKLKVQLARALSSLIYGGRRFMYTSYSLCRGFIRTWFCTRRYSDIVRKLIINHLEDLDEPQKIWASSLHESPQELFRPLIAACARKWLTKNDWHDPEYLDKPEDEVRIMYAYTRLLSDGRCVNALTRVWNVPVAAIEHLANLEPLPKNEHWYTGVAMVIMKRQQKYKVDRAIEYFKKALEIKPGGWVAMEGLAKCYAEVLHDYTAAIDLMEDAIRHLPRSKDYEGVEFLLLTKISEWKSRLGSDEETVDTARAAYMSSRLLRYGTGSAIDISILRSVKLYIEILYRTHQYHSIVELLFELDRTVTLERNKSLWIVFLQSQKDSYYDLRLFEKLEQISLRVSIDGHRDFMWASIERALELKAGSLQRHWPVELALQAAKWQYRYASRPEDAIELFEKIVAFVDESMEDVQQFHVWARSIAAGFLGMIYFNTTKELFESGEDSTIYRDKLTRLAKRKQGSKQDYFASYYPSLILGLWYREYAKTNEERWMACIGPFITEALLLLGDDDPWKDQQSYANFGQTLHLAGDDLNASIALGITLIPPVDTRIPRRDSVTLPKVQGIQRDLQLTAMRPEEHHNDEIIEEVAVTSVGEGMIDADAEDSVTDSKTKITVKQRNSGEDDDIAETAARPSIGELEATATNPKYHSFDLWWTCDGPCETPSSSYAELYFCRVCYDICFCEKCRLLVEANKMPYRCCSKDHPLLRVFPLTEEAKNVADAIVEGQYEVQQQWLDELKKAWQLDGPHAI